MAGEFGCRKPYDNMIDNRLEDYLEAKAAAGQGDSRKTSALLAARSRLYDIPFSF